MMNTDDQKYITEIVAIAQSIINGQKNVVESLRKMLTLLHKTSYIDDEIFLPIRGVEAETDEYPLGDAREGYSKAYLQRQDEEMEEYLEKVRIPLIEACKNIVCKYNQRDGVD